MTTPPNLRVGDAVLCPRERAVGLIYEVYARGPYARPGVQVLLSDGRDLSGFSAEEADQFLQPVGHTGLAYEFRDVGRLHADYQRGLFASAFATARLLAGFRDIEYLNVHKFFSHAFFPLDLSPAGFPAQQAYLAIELPLTSAAEKRHPWKEAYRRETQGPF